jgi:uncharacterized membrane protein
MLVTVSLMFRSFIFKVIMATDTCNMRKIRFYIQQRETMDRRVNITETKRPVDLLTGIPGLVSWCVEHLLFYSYTRDKIRREMLFSALITVFSRRSKYNHI